MLVSIGKCTDRVGFPTHDTVERPGHLPHRVHEPADAGPAAQQSCTSRPAMRKIGRWIVAIDTNKRHELTSRRPVCHHYGRRAPTWPEHSWAIHLCGSRSSASPARGHKANITSRLLCLMVLMGQPHIRMIAGCQRGHIYGMRLGSKTSGQPKRTAPSAKCPPPPTTTRPEVLGFGDHWNTTAHVPQDRGFRGVFPGRTCIPNEAG